MKKLHMFVYLPFLYLPFSSETPFEEITEGWLYSAAEQAVHGYKTHYAVDFKAPLGTPVYAAADGLSVASSHFVYLQRFHEEKQVGFGLGNFVQIWHPEAKLFTQYGHLERSADIPYLNPVPKGDGWDPVPAYRHLSGEILAKAKPVKRGDLIGWVGDSGCSWGYKEMPGQPRPDPQQFPSWDETHLHFEVFDRDAEGKKQTRLDPFDIYSQAEAYKGLKPGLKGLWVVYQEGRPQFAR